MQKFSLIGPPLLLVIIGAAAYIVVVKLSTPDPIVVRGTPQSTVSATQPTITPSDISFDTTAPTAEQISDWQRKATEGVEDWRYDPLAAAKHQGEAYGFATEDPFQLTSQDQSSPQISATHDDKHYIIRMAQVGEEGQKKVWYISGIEAS
jgi:hypothetical protein